MINRYEVYETNQMIAEENLDVRTITLGISLLDCIDADLDKLNENIYNKITTVAKDLVKTGEEIEQEFGIPIVNKRISITPVALIVRRVTEYYKFCTSERIIFFCCFSCLLYNFTTQTYCIHVNTGLR